MAANFVSEQHPEDASVRIPDGFSSGAALDFASSILCWVTYHLFASIKGIVGIFVSILFLAGLIRWNYKKNNSDNHL